MRQLTEKQKKRLEKLAKVLDGGSIAIVQQIAEVEDRLEEVASQIPELRQAVDGVDGRNGVDGYTPIKDVDYRDGVDGYTPIKGVDYVDGKDGRTPIHIGKQQPLNPKLGDLWYQD